MKKTLLRAFAASILTIILTIAAQSCRKGGINDDLDGQWRIITIENLATGAVSEPVNHFICLYLHTVNLSRGTVITTGNMTYSGTRLTLEFPYNTDNTSLNAWGIFNWQTTFEIVHLDSSRMTLRSDAAVITLRKF